MHVEIEQLPTLRLGVVPHFGAYNQIASAFERLGAIAGPAGLFALPSVLLIAAYHDDPDATPIEELRSEACVTIPDGVAMPAGLEERHITAGPYARYIHIGPYEVLGDVWSRFMGEGLPSSGFEVIEGPSLEIYRNDFRTIPPEQLHTDLLVPCR